MIPFKSGSLEFSLPSKWGDLTFEQFYKLKESDGGLPSVVSILSGIDKSILDKCDDVDLYDKLGIYLDWMKEPFDVQDYLLADTIEVDGKRYNKPNGIGLQTAGQKWHLEDAYREASEKGGTEIDIMAKCLAIYLQPTITNSPYDSDLVEKIYPSVLKCKLSEGWGMASFFLTSYEKYSKEKMRIFHIHQVRKSYEQELTALINSESFRQFSIWRRFSIKVLRWLFSRITTLYTLPSYMKPRAAVTKES